MLHESNLFVLFSLFLLCLTRRTRLTAATVKTLRDHRTTNTSSTTSISSTVSSSICSTVSGSVTHRHVSPQFVSLLPNCQTCPNFSENTPTFLLPLPETSSMEGAEEGGRRVLSRLKRRNSDTCRTVPLHASKHVGSEEILTSQNNTTG